MKRIKLKQTQNKTKEHTEEQVLKMDISSSTQNKSFCYDLPIAVGNQTFCGLEEKWTPRFNHGALLAMTIIPALVYWLVLLWMIKIISNELVRVWKIYMKEEIDFEKEEKECSLYEKEEGSQRREKKMFRSIKKSSKWGCLFRIKSCIPFVVMPLLKFSWDAIDMTLDVYIFYKLESGAILDNAIYRNKHVNNAIYAFAIIGCIAKIIILKYVLEVSLKDEDDASIDDIKGLKYHITVASFAFEDGPELILEYFYIEKYITSYTLLLVVKDVFVACCNIQGAFSAISFIKNDVQYEENTIYKVALSGAILAMPAATLLRFGGALYQYITKKLRRSCFKIETGRILQTPCRRLLY